MISTTETAELVKKFGKNPKNTGSTEVQVALLTTRILNLAPHFQAHKLDFAGNRGLLKLIGQRRRLLSYLAKKDEKRYNDLIAALGLRK